jgi:hypothetical protein
MVYMKLEVSYWRLNLDLSSAEFGRVVDLNWKTSVRMEDFTTRCQFEYQIDQIDPVSQLSVQLLSICVEMDFREIPSQVGIMECLRCLPNERLIVAI